MLLADSITFNINAIDEMAVMMAIVGYTVVFTALAVMVIVLVRISRIQEFLIRRRLKNLRSAEEAETPAVTVSGDENAAICTALYLYFSELHDQEKTVMTVKKISKTYSPWSSKIYGVMNVFKNR